MIYTCQNVRKASLSCGPARRWSPSLFDEGDSEGSEVSSLQSSEKSCHLNIIKHRHWTHQERNDTDVALIYLPARVEQSSVLNLCRDFNSEYL